MLAALACVDYVVVFDEASVAGLVDRVGPDVLVKADQYTTEQVVGHESVLRRGGHVVSVPTQAALFDDRSDPAASRTFPRLANAVPRKVVSIIICTRDRAESLKETLRAVGETPVPADLAAEVLVVDNGSRDRTRPVVRQAKFWGRAPRYLYEPRLGVSYARNTGMAAAQGEVLLWTDDDVRPGRAWIEAMCRPILDGRADAVAGRVKLPDYLERPWLRPWHRVCLAVDAPTDGRFRSDRREHGFRPPRAGKGARLRSGTWRGGAWVSATETPLFPAARDGRLSPRWRRAKTRPSSITAASIG